MLITTSSSSSSFLFIIIVIIAMIVLTNPFSISASPEERMMNLEEAFLLSPPKNNFITSFISESSLFKSTPDPRMFGNPKNPPKNSPARKGWDQENWLTSRFHFSFAEYSDRKRSGFGVMHVLNDDRVSPKRMFGMHPHQNQEVVSVIVEGQLTHEDTLKNRETLSRGSVQYLSAGTGISHSEGNNGDSMLRFCQLWFNPRRRGVKPNYGSLSSADYDPELRHNKFFHMITDVENKNPEFENVKVRLHCDVNLYISEIDAGMTVKFAVNAKRAIYTVCCECEDVTAKMKSGNEGAEQVLSRHDAVTVRAKKETSVEFVNNGEKKVFLLLVELENPWR